MGTLKAVTAATAAMAGIVAAAIPAQAASRFFSQEYRTSSGYTSSSDFTPSAGAFSIGGKGCAGGSAKYWYVELVKTSGSAHVFSSYSYPADTVTRDDLRTATKAPGGTSYYIRWRGESSPGGATGYTAPCHYVEAIR
jgi:hypothetical protein